MKYWLLPFFGLCFAVEADTPATPPVTLPAAPAAAAIPAAPAAPSTAAPAPEGAPKRSANDLDQLVSPIALYPDPILAILLPASTSPVDVVMAARQLKAGATLDQIQKQPWDDSLKALTHYPEIVKWLDENLEWTSALGEAVAVQQSDVMAAIQRMRGKAKAVGNLPNTAQQEISVDNGMIEIEPAQADTVCVPYYDPSMAYSEAPSDVASSAIDYGAPLPAGDWLSYDLDWPTGGIWFSDFGSAFRHHHHDHGHFWFAGSGRFFGGGAGFAANGTGVPHPAFSSRTPSFHRFGSFAFTGVRPSAPSFTRTTAAIIPGSTANTIPRSGIFEGGRTVGGVESRPRVVEGTSFVPQRVVTERTAPGFVPQRTFVNPGRPERGFVESRPVEVQQTRPMNVEPQRAVVPERGASRVTETPRGGSATFSGGGRSGGGGSTGGTGIGWR